MTTIRTLGDLGFRAGETLEQGGARLGIQAPKLSDIRSLCGVKGETQLSEAVIGRSFVFPDFFEASNASRAHELEAVRGRSGAMGGGGFGGAVQLMVHGYQNRFGSAGQAAFEPMTFSMGLPDGKTIYVPRGTKEQFFNAFERAGLNLAIERARALMASPDLVATENYNGCPCYRLKTAEEKKQEALKKTVETLEEPFRAISRRFSHVGGGYVVRLTHQDAYDQAFRAMNTAIAALDLDRARAEAWKMLSIRGKDVAAAYGNSKEFDEYRESAFQAWNRAAEYLTVPLPERGTNPFLTQS